MMILSDLTETASRFGGMAARIFQDRLELLALEVREAKIRLVQMLLLACAGVVFSLLGLVLLVLAGVYALPPEWRLHGFVAVGAAGLLAGAAALAALRRRLGRRPLAFDQSIAELKKDAACFSTRD